MSQPTDRTPLISNGPVDGTLSKPVNGYSAVALSVSPDQHRGHFNIHNLHPADFYWILVGLWSA
jgi:hypothetical protein